MALPRQAGSTATAFKAIVYCPGYRFALISESGLGDGPPKVVAVQLDALGSVPLVGRVSGIPSPERLSIDVMYFAVWGHPFFGQTDGFVASFRVTSTPLKPDGSFATKVPDFAHDPVVAGYVGKEQGHLQLAAHDPRGSITYFLQPREGATRQFELPIANVYPGEMEFLAVAR